MTAQDAKAVAQQLGKLEPTSDRITAEIKRLNRQKIVTLKQVEVFHQWLEGKRQAKQSCRVVGESRVGKTVACNSYRLRHKPIQQVGKPPIVPVVYIRHLRLVIALVNCLGKILKKRSHFWERDVLKLPVASNLTAKNMMKSLGQATGGYIGLLDMILQTIEQLPASK